MADSRVLLAGWEKLSDALWQMLRGPFCGRDLGFTAPRLDSCARPSRAQRGDVAQKRAIYRLRHHAERAVRARRRAARIERKKACRFFGAQSRPSRNDHLPQCFSPAADVMHIQADGSVRQSRYCSASRDCAHRACLRSGLCRALARASRYRGAPANAQRFSGRLSAQPGDLDFLRLPRWPPARWRKKNERLAAFTGVPRRGFDGAVPPVAMPTRTPYVEAIARAVGNIDVTHVENGRCNDFAELERCFIALEGPVRDPTNLGWMIAICARRARKAGACCSAAFRQLHHQLERLVAVRHAPACAAGC